ncbi:UBAC2 isoform 1, partial [Pan troglodytes]
MFTSTGSSGLYKAPLSKSLLLVPSALSLLLALLLPHCQKLFVYDLHAVKNDFQMSGLCYDSKMFQVHQVLCIPSWMAKFFSWTLEPIFSSSEPTSEARIGMGATLDIQRQQRMELLDRQLMFSQFAQGRRQRQQQGGMINWNRLFPPLRQRQNVNYQGGRQSEPAAPPLEVSEEQVARLMEMGFSRGDALEALRASNNDLNVAT